MYLEARATKNYLEKSRHFEKRPRTTSEVIEANYLEVAEEVCFKVGSSKNDAFDGFYTVSSTSQLSTSEAKEGKEATEAVLALLTTLPTLSNGHMQSVSPLALKMNESR